MAGSIYDMLMGEEPDAAASAQALARSIRGQRAMGAVGATAGGGLPGLGKVNDAQALQDQNQLEKAAEARMKYGIEKQNRDALLKQTMMQVGSQAALERERIKAMTSMYGADSRASTAADKLAIGKSGRPLGSGEVDKITKADTLLGETSNLAESFKPEYAGTGIMGGVPVWIDQVRGSSASPKDRERANWWADYSMYIDNLRRHEMFGSAFTKTEQAAWNRAQRIKPGADPGEVKAALEDLRNSMGRVLQQHIRGRVAEGTSPEVVGAFAPNSVSRDWARPAAKGAPAAGASPSAIRKQGSDGKFYVKTSAGWEPE